MFSLAMQFPQKFQFFASSLFCMKATLAIALKLADSTSFIYWLQCPAHFNSPQPSLRISTVRSCEAMGLKGKAIPTPSESLWLGWLPLCGLGECSIGVS